MNVARNVSIVRKREVAQFLIQFQRDIHRIRVKVKRSNTITSNARSQTMFGVVRLLFETLIEERNVRNENTMNWPLFNTGLKYN